MAAPANYQNKRFHKLVGISFLGYKNGANNRKRRLWLWRCDCGKTKPIVAEKVSSGWVKSCGCLVGEFTGLQSLQWRVFRDSVYSDADITFRQFLQLSQEPCHYCGEWKPNNRKSRRGSYIFSYHGLNRLDHNKKHSLDNVVPCCWGCNNRISNTDHSDFMEWISKVYNNRNK